MKKRYLIPENVKSVDNTWKFMNKLSSEDLLNNLSYGSFLNDREISEIYNMWLLEEAVDVFEDMYSSDKTLKQCAEQRGIHDIREMFHACYVQSLIRFFTENKEEYFIWLIDDSVLNNRLNRNLIKVLDWDKSHRVVIKEIREALCHRRYIIWKDWLYINNPKGQMHKQSFKALIKWEYLNDVWKISGVSHSFRFHKFNDENVDYSKGFKDNNWKFSYIRYTKSKNKNRPFTFGDFWNLVSGSNDEKDFINDETLCEQKLSLSVDQLDVIEKFFEKYQFNPANLEEVLWHVEDWRHLYDHFYMWRFFSNVWDEKELTNDVDKMWQDAINEKELAKKVNGFDFTCKDLFPKSSFDKFWNLNISSGFFADNCLFPWELALGNLVNDYCINLVPTYLKMLYIINSYLNDTSITMGPWAVSDQTRSIRDVLAHWHYSLIPWADDVLLYDPKWNYHWRFNIDDLYKERKKYESQRKHNLENLSKKGSD